MNPFAIAVVALYIVAGLYDLPNRRAAVWFSFALANSAIIWTQGR